MTTRLKIYNLCLGTYVGTQMLANLTENVASRHALDKVYDSGLEYMLEQGLWKFALKTVNLTTLRQDTAIHRQHRYPMPSDYVRTAGISSTPRFDSRQGFEDFEEENGFLYSDSNSLWLQYVSKAETHGLNLALWPANYEQAVASWLAYQSALPISKDKGDRADLLRLHQLTLSTARRLDAVDEAVKSKPAGRWPRSRGWGGVNGTMRGLR